MKKNLLALFVLSAMMYSASAQDTYIKDAVVVKVNPNTLFYNGGSVSVTTDAKEGTTEKIINEGNIQIQGGFTNENTNGKNFVNKYTDSNSYGQLIIKDATTVTGKIALERSKPNLIDNDEYVISLPYKNIPAKDVINSMLNQGDFFRGDCELDVDCGLDKRYSQSLFVWDVKETEYDAVTNSSTIDPKSRYLLNLRKGSTVRNTISSLPGSVLALAGIPNNNQINYTLKSGLKGGSQDFANLTWKNWKNKINNYAESYDSYLGNQLGTKYDNDKLFGKNLHRIGNPFTSNLDLSNVNTGSSWITFNTASGTNQSPAGAWGALRFRVFKIANDYTIKWSSGSGNTSTNHTTLSAYLQKDPNNSKYFWTGSPEALLVKPYESFYVDYYIISPTGNGSLIINANVNLKDENKTFNNGFTFTGNGTYERNISQTESKQSEADFLNNQRMIDNGLVTDFDFTQLELYLSNDNQIQGNAAYLLNANFMTTGNFSTPTTVENSVFFFEEDKDGNVLTDVQTLTNQFNNEDYIGKPLRIGFNNLESGKNYRLNLNLYEYSILNKVKSLNLGKYYLYDNLTNKAIEVNETTELNFVADAKINERFEFYWNELPSKLGTDDLNDAKATFLYTDNGNQFVKFEQNNTTADIAIFDLTGRQIFYKTNIVTTTDYKLNLTNVPNVYVVKIVYKDGKIVTKKTINK